MGSIRRFLLFAALLSGCNADGPGLIPPPAPVIFGDGPGLTDGGGAGPTDGGSGDAGLSPDGAPSGADGPVADLSCTPIKKACGRCGQQPILCVAGVPTPGACEGEHGDCTPPASEENACLARFCGATCWWGPWALKPGYSCITGSSRSCPTNPATCSKSTGTQQCVACQWTSCKCPN